MSDDPVIINVIELIHILSVRQYQLFSGWKPWTIKNHHRHHRHHRVDAFVDHLRCCDFIPLLVTFFILQSSNFTPSLSSPHSFSSLTFIPSTAVHRFIPLSKAHVSFPRLYLQSELLVLIASCSTVHRHPRHLRLFSASAAPIPHS